MTPGLAASPLLPVAGVGLVVLALCGGAFAVLGHDARERRLALRLASCVAPLAPAATPATSLAERLGMSRQTAMVRARAASLLGFDTARADAYPLRIVLLLLLATVPAALAMRLIGRVIGLPLEAATPIAWVFFCRMLFATLHARHADRLYRQFPDALAMIVRSVRAGIPLHEALRTVARESPAPTTQQFARVADEMAIGMRLDDSLRAMATRTGVPEYAFFSVALTLQMQTGGSLAETLEGLADVIRKRVALRRRAVALASEARTSAGILATLPILTGLALAVINYDYVRPLFETLRGERILYTAIGLLLFAGLVMRGMIQRSLR